MSKEELAESRWTVTQLADRWWGFDSANALLLRSEVVMEEDSVRVRHFDTAISSSGWTPTLKISVNGYTSLIPSSTRSTRSSCAAAT